MSQIKRRILGIALTILSVFYSLWRGRATQKIVPKSYVVIYATKNIGDMVFVTPLFKAIKKHDPQASITVVCTPKNQQLLQNNTDIDAYVHVTDSVWQIIKTLRNKKIDAGVVIAPDAISFATLFLAGVKVISGFTFGIENKRLEARPYRIVSQLAYTTKYVSGQYITYQTLGLLKPFGIEDMTVTKHLGYSEKAMRSIDVELEKSGIHRHENIIAIAPGAGTKIKEWPAERFGHLANLLSKKFDIVIAIIGGPGDVTESEQMIVTLEKGVRYINFVGQSLDELKATLSKVVCIIGNDSGSIYIAESFGAGTLVLIGPTDEAEHIKQDSRHRIVVPIDRGSPLLKSYLTAEDNINQTIARSQIESITVEQVFREASALFEEITGKTT